MAIRPGVRWLDSQPMSDSTDAAPISSGVAASSSGQIAGQVKVWPTEACRSAHLRSIDLHVIRTRPEDQAGGVGQRGGKHVKLATLQGVQCGLFAPRSTWGRIIVDDADYKHLFEIQSSKQPHLQELETEQFVITEYPMM